MRIVMKSLELVGRGVFTYCAAIGILWLLAVGLAGIYKIPLYVQVGDGKLYLVQEGFVVSRLYLSLGIGGLLTLLFLLLVRLAKIAKWGIRKL